MLVAVTGSNGFVGKHLCRSLRESGYQVRPIQRQLERHVFVIKDLTDIKNLNKALSGVDVIIHCASKVHSNQNLSKENIEKYNSINVKATEKIALQAVKANIKRFIFISSIKVNGELTKNRNSFTNKSNPNPHDLYAKSKLEAEQKLLEISNSTNLEVVIIRPPLVYGPEVGANFLSLIKLVDFGIPLPFMNIKNKRSIIYVGNLVDFISSCIENISAKNKIFLVSDIKNISTPDLIRLIYKNFKKRPRLYKFPVILLKIISYLTFTRSRLSRLLESLEIDPTETYEEMMWTPPFTTNEGLADTIDWFIKKNKK